MPKVANSPLYQHSAEDIFFRPEVLDRLEGLAGGDCINLWGIHVQKGPESRGKGEVSPADRVN